MLAFVDTSSLIKRYIHEKQTDQFNSLLDKLSGVIVSPVTIVELFSGIVRRLRDKSLTKKQYQLIEEEILKNVKDFHQVQFNEELESICIHLLKKYPLRTLDAIQLASAQLSSVNTLVTSDKRLCKAAEKEIERVIFI